MDTLRPYPATKDSGVDWLGELPGHWESVPLRRYCRVFAGATPSRATPEYWNGGTVPWLASGDVNLRRITGAKQFITEAGHVASSTKWIRPGSLVLALAGQGRTKGMVATVECWTTCNQSLAAIEPSPRIANHKFLAYYLESRYLDIRGLVGDGLRDGLNLEHVRAIPTPLPPLSEQAAIVRFLDDATSRIERHIRAKEKLIELLEERKSVTVQLAVTGRIDVRTGRPYAAYEESGLKSLPTIPSHWDVRPAKWHFREVEERSNTGSEELLSVSHITGVTPRSEKTVTMFEAESNVGHKLCKAGDLVVNTMWAWMAALGVARQEGMVSPSYAVYRRNHDSALSSDYAELILRSAPYRFEYKMRSTGIRPSRLRLYPDEFLRIRLVCPPEQEQAAVMEFVKHEVANVERTSRLMREGIGSLQAYRKRLIAEAVTGKIDVRKTGSRAL